MMPFAAEVFARHVGMDRRGSSFVSESFFFQGFCRNTAKGTLKLLSLGVHHALWAPWGRGLSPWARGSHYVPAPSSGICPGKEYPRKEKVQKSQFPPVSSKVGTRVSRRY